MRIYLIRHGQTDWNVLGKIQGSTDTSLNKDGILQAKAVSGQMKERFLEITRVYSSPQKRALQTAEIIGETLGCEVIAIDSFQEMNFGKWEGLTWEEVQRDYAQEYARWHLNRRYSKLPKGESYQETLERVVKGLQQLTDEESGDFAVVTHSAVIRCIQCFVTDTPFEKMRKFRLENTAIVEIDSDKLDKAFR